MIGKFMTYYEAPHVYLSEEIDLAVTIARQLGFSIERARSEQARRKAEEELRKTAGQLALITNTAPALIAHCDAAGRFKFVNRAYAERLGLQPEDCIGKPIAEIVGAEGFEVFRHHVERALQGHFVRFEAEVPYASIGRRYVEVSYAPEFTADGEVAGYVAAIADITERKQAEAALLESERRFKTLASQAPVGIFQTDAEGNCLFVSDKWCELAGMSPEAAQGKGWVAALHPDDRDRVFREWYDAAASGGEFQSEYRFCTPTGTISWLRGSARAVRDASGRITGYIGSVIDITAHKLAEERQSLLINELHHRVKNTLATVQAIVSQTLRAANADAEVQQAMEARLRALAAAHNLLSRDNWVGADIRHVAAQTLQPHAGADRLHLDGPPLRLSAKAAVAIAMGLQELATNAVKYGAWSAPDGRVAVRWSIAGSPEALTLQWTESGGPTVSTPQRSGFGSRLLPSLARDLGGAIAIDYRPSGLACTLTAPREAVEA